MGTIIGEKWGKLLKIIEMNKRLMLILNKPMSYHFQFIINQIFLMFVLK